MSEGWGRRVARGAGQVVRPHGAELFGDEKRGGLYCIRRDAEYNAHISVTTEEDIVNELIWVSVLQLSRRGTLSSGVATCSQLARRPRQLGARTPAAKLGLHAQVTMRWASSGQACMLHTSGVSHLPPQEQESNNTGAGMAFSKRVRRTRLRGGGLRMVEGLASGRRQAVCGSR